MARRSQQDRLNMAELERLYQVHTDMEGQIDEPSIWKDFREYLTADAERCLPDSVLADYRERYDKVHRLKASDLEQPSLPGFEDRYLPQMGNQPPIWMLRASREQLISWLAVETAEHVVSVAAYSLKTTRTSEWLAAWGPEDTTLGDVLKRLYPQ
jgi:hypothetical protein